MPTFIKKRS